MALRVVAMFAALLAWPVQSLQAQGFFQQFLGNGPPPRLYGYGAVPYYRSPYAWPPRPYQSDSDSDGALTGRASTYRTLCVRLCDGYYFPISSAVPSSSFSRDADTCSASCGAEARLFYYSNAGGDVESMTDLTGLAYSSLPNAFMYRKALVPECRCRPQPWSEAELERHRGYAQSRPATVDATQGSSAPGRARAAVRPTPPAADAWSGPSAWPSTGNGSGRATRSYDVWPSGRRYRD
jgi:Protein of unknown function (DUF2865)